MPPQVGATGPDRCRRYAEKQRRESCVRESGSPRQQSDRSGAEDGCAQDQRETGRDRDRHLVTLELGSHVGIIAHTTARAAVEAQHFVTRPERAPTQTRLLDKRVVPEAAVVSVFGEDRRPEWSDALLAEVDIAFESTGAGTPAWPDPHRGHSPRDDEYSRVSDVSKYRILDARVDAWIQVLADAGLARTREVPAVPWVDAPRPPSELMRVREIEPDSPGGLVLCFATTLVDGAPFGLDVGITRGGDTPVFVELVPTCGCDACDHGSADLLDVVDGWVLTVARGGVVHARRGADSATRTFQGWSTSAGAAESWLDDSSPAPIGVERWAGLPWHGRGVDH